MSINRMANETYEDFRQRMISDAIQLYCSDNDIEVGEDARLSVDEEGTGTWVQAWVWVPFVGGINLK